MPEYDCHAGQYDSGDLIVRNAPRLLPHENCWLGDHFRASIRSDPVTWNLNGEGKLLRVSEIAALRLPYLETESNRLGLIHRQKSTSEEITLEISWTMAGATSGRRIRSTRFCPAPYTCQPRNFLSTQLEHLDFVTSLIHSMRPLYPHSYRFKEFHPFHVD